MIKRTIEISREPMHLAIKLGQLQLLRHEASATEPVASVPCEDIGMVVVDHGSTTYSHAAFTQVLEAGGVFVLCGRNHLPVGLALPITEHTEVVWRIHDQIAVGLPLKKRLWRQIVVAKIRAQAGNLAPEDPTQRQLHALAGQVRSGDVGNVESQAAKLYWAAWLGSGVAFRRDPDGDGINALLNYGYAIMRAAVARALVAAGLHPALGLHHANRSNPFCLADDLVEPLRPMVDARVRELRDWNMTELNQAAKKQLLGLLTATVRVGDQTGPLMVGLHKTVASLVQCYRGTEKKLLLPISVPRQDQEENSQHT